MTSYIATESGSRGLATEIGGWGYARYAEMNQWDLPRAQFHDDLAEVRAHDWVFLCLESTKIAQAQMQESLLFADLDDDGLDPWINWFAHLTHTGDEIRMLLDDGFSNPTDRNARAYASALFSYLNMHVNLTFNSESDLNRERTELSRRQYEERIKHLRELAKEEEDLDLNPQSEKDFWLFIKSIPMIRKGGLVLLDNGDLRALWKDDDGARIGLQFRGGGEVEYVIFSKGLLAGDEKHEYGRGDFELVKGQIKDYNLWSLVSD